MSSRLGAPFMIKDLVHRNAMAVLFTAKHLPEVTLEVVEVKPARRRASTASGRAWPIAKAMPTMSYLAQKTNLYPKDMLTVGGRGQGRRRRPADRPLPRPGGLQEGPARAAVHWSCPASARSSTSSWSRARARSRSSTPLAHGGRIEKTVKLD
ncbi:MAG: hypothetical protein MZU79_04530 [Anaerotruncus sp.]|nr:hypothetical protein [Anaerotruncus sp.]